MARRSTAAAKTSPAKTTKAVEEKPPLLRVAREPHYAALNEVEEFAAGLKVTYLYCRELGHNWKPKNALPYEDGGWVRTLNCTRCRTKRLQDLSSTGEILRTKYEHPEGYLHAGMGRIVGDGRGILRLESIKRINKDSAQEAS